MKPLNFHHLRYFWAVATEGSMVAAGRRLGVSQPTLTSQIQALEDEFDEQLFIRRGKRLELTEAGQVVLRHAGEIFRLGDELVRAVEGRSDEPLLLTVGVSDSVSKLVVRSLLEPALRLERSVALICREWRTDLLLAELSVHRLDLVVTDAPMQRGMQSRTVSQSMGESPIGMYAIPELARRLRRGFPRSLHGAPLLLPADNTTLREKIDRFLDTHAIKPRIVAETEDRTLMNYFGQSGWGAFPVAMRVEKEIRRQFGVERVGLLRGVREQYFVVSIERNLRHPAVAAICASANERYRSKRA